MQTGAAIADLRAGDERRPFAEAGGRRSAAGALRDILVDLAILIWARAEAFDRGIDEPRVELLQPLPGEAHAIENAGAEILDQHVAGFNEAFEDLFALRVLRVERDRALVVVEHGEIEAVGAGHVAQLRARDVANAGALDLDAIGAEPREQLGAGGS